MQREYPYGILAKSVFFVDCWLCLFYTWGLYPVIWVNTVGYFDVFLVEIGSITGLKLILRSIHELFRCPFSLSKWATRGGGWAPIRTTQHLKSPLDMSLQVIIGWVYPPPRMAVTTKIITMKTWWGFLLHPPWTTCFIPYHLLGPVHLGHRVLHFWYHDAGYLDVVDHVCLACFLEVCITLPENQQLALKIWWFQIGISSSRGSIFRG